MAGVKASKPKTVPMGGGANRTFVLGSRPPDYYAPRIKPLDGQTQYGKGAATPPSAAGAGPRQPNFNIGSGQTNRPGF